MPLPQKNLNLCGALRTPSSTSKQMRQSKASTIGVARVASGGHVSAGSRFQSQSGQVVQG